jgi:hypothetical protein
MQQLGGLWKTMPLVYAAGAAPPASSASAGWNA